MSDDNIMDREIARRHGREIQQPPSRTQQFKQSFKEKLRSGLTRVMDNIRTDMRQRRELNAERKKAYQEQFQKSIISAERKKAKRDAFERVNRQSGFGGGRDPFYFLAPFDQREHENKKQKKKEKEKKMSVNWDAFKL